MRHYLRDPTLAVLIQYWSVTDKQTDIQWRIYRASIASCGKNKCTTFFLNTVYQWGSWWPSLANSNHIDINGHILQNSHIVLFKLITMNSSKIISQCSQEHHRARSHAEQWGNIKTRAEWKTLDGYPLLPFDTGKQCSHHVQKYKTISRPPTISDITTGI